jgi:tungstate transport system substrate-binding protein
MAPTLRVASQRAAYCLTDRATFLQLENELSLRRIYGGGPDLLNTYAVMVVRRPGSAAEAMAAQLAGWLTDGDGRRLIAGFKVKGVNVYTVWPAGVPRDTPSAVPRQDP